MVYHVTTARPCSILHGARVNDIPPGFQNEKNRVGRGGVPIMSDASAAGIQCGDVV